MSSKKEKLIAFVVIIFVAIISILAGIFNLFYQLMISIGILTIFLGLLILLMPKLVQTYFQKGNKREPIDQKIIQLSAFNLITLGLGLVIMFSLVLMKYVLLGQFLFGTNIGLSLLVSYFLTKGNMEP